VIYIVFFEVWIPESFSVAEVAFKGHSVSSSMSPLDRLYMTSY